MSATDTNTNTVTPKIVAITLDCTDAHAVATFWAAALGRDVGEGASADYAAIPGTPPLMFFSVPEAKTVKNRMHLDLESADVAAEVTRLIALGARHLADFDEHGFSWTTLADPEGNEFDIVAAGGH